ncbi:phage late control D family protein [Laribacter hongkongensis]|uniref:phage late control D family protein n=1 Tax=Laribacter hongkongensis TaxID=168471 RepID=UPI00041BA68E|nr:contractile injection system protein, VgrG/Pvc8 family [Laribacter hongkongensis]
METLTPAGIRRPWFRLDYEKKDVSTDISQFLRSLTYTDRQSGESDEIEIKLEDCAGRWMDAWYPTKGDEVSLWIGYADEAPMPCGMFQIDEIEMDGPPSTVSIRALASGIRTAIRTPYSKAYTGTTLASMAAQIAQRNQLTLAGNPEPVPLGRIAQTQETDLAFLHRIARDYDHVVSVRGKQLYCAPRDSIINRDAVLVVSSLEQIKRWRMRDKTSAVYRSVTVCYLDPKTKKLVEHTETAAQPARKKKGGKETDKVKDEVNDTLKVNERCDSKAQAVARAKALLKDKNLKAVEGEVVMLGEPRLVAGNALGIDCLGRLSGDYTITESRHVIDGSGGYETTVQIQRVRAGSERTNRKKGAGDDGR